MERLKKLRAKALRKVGVSIYDRIFNVDCPPESFLMITKGKRSVVVAEYDKDFKIGALVRLRETKPFGIGHTSREAYYFIKDILRPLGVGLFPVFCVLTLE
jgi:hypothetical protein